MSPTTASMGTAKRSKKRKPIATPPESEETVTVESREEMQEPEQQEKAGDEEPVEAGGQETELGYCIVPSEKRLLVLHAFLKRKLSKKVMVIFSSCSSVKFHAELLSSLQLECSDIHEEQKQQKRTATFSNFCTSEKGILLCTNAAARGLDIPDVDYIVQYDPLHEPQDYIHNAERIARAEKGKGSVLLFLLPQELEFLVSLRAANIRLTEFEFSSKNVPYLQARFEKIVGENYFLHQLAQEAYRSYILAYHLHAMKETFNIHGLNLKDVAASFCIKNPPKVNIGPESNAKKKINCGGKRHGINTV